MKSISTYQDSPNAVQIEPVEGCQLACSFCGIQSIRDNEANGLERFHGTNSGPFKFMEINTAIEIAHQIIEAGWNPRVEFAMHGEPTMHPDLPKLVSIFRKRLPKSSLMVTTNGGGLLRATTIEINALMDAGINVILLDNYDRMKTVERILARYKGPYPFYNYPKDQKANPHRRRKPSEHHTVITEDVSHESGGTHGKLMTHAACAFPRDFSLQGDRCARPFREVSIRWNGNVALCCMDWVGIYKCGNVLHQSINDIWQGPQFKAARRALFYGYRTFSPCYGCNTRSYRVGLLPDRMGKETLEKPTKETWRVIEKSLKEPHYTEYVERSWMPRDKLVVVKRVLER
jgi:MoaA/NifB/PqqE/SkfB family radical SAM enzyme